MTNSTNQLTKEDKIEYAQQLRELLYADENFRNWRKDDSYLLRFLHCTDFNVHLAYRKIDDYYSLWLDNPDWFANGSPLNIKNEIEAVKKGFLRDIKDNEGRRVYLALIGSIDPEKITCIQNAHLDEYWFELILDDPATQELGVTLIIDTKDTSWKLWKWLTPTNLKIASKKLELFPCKELVYHFVNTSMMVNSIVRMVLPFLSHRIKKRFNFHNNFETLHEHIDPSVLPPEYGGTANPIKFEEMNKCLFENALKIEDNLKHQDFKKKSSN